MDKNNNERSDMRWIELSRADKYDSLQVTSANTGYPDYAIEKDWWVTEILRVLKTMAISENMVFKGGTSLSKAWGIINRFSEDIDLAINREFFGFKGDISRTQVGKLRDASCHYLTGDFIMGFQRTIDAYGLDVRAVPIEVTTPDKDPVKIEIQYEPVVNYPAYIKPRVLVEIGSRSMMEPSQDKKMTSFIEQTNPRLPFVEEPVVFPTVTPERTLIEKLFLLHEEHQRPEDKMQIEYRSRHFYDIYKLADTEFAQKAIEDKDLYASIVAHRELFSKMGGVDYALHFPPHLNPIPRTEELLAKWKADYENVRTSMILEPDSEIRFETVLEKVKELTERFNVWGE